MAQHGRKPLVPREAVDLVRSAADPDMALRNLERYLEAAGRPPSDLGAAVTLFAGSQSLSDAVALDPSLLERVLADRRLPGATELRTRVGDRIDADPGDPRVPLRRFVREETLRLLLADLTGEADLARVAAMLSRIAEAAIDAALSVALREATERHGVPRHDDGEPASIAVIGMGKLGGGELNYSSDIDLLFLYSDEGRTDAPDPGRARRNRELFAKVVERTSRLLADPTPLGHCYRVDLRLRPDGAIGAITRTVASALAYYLGRGRPWERQALIKARPVAGDLELGREGFLAPVSEFVYGTPLTLEAIRSMKDLKRRIERRGREREVKVGPGGIRDVEFTVQFLQLLHGARHPRVREPGTLPALARLEAEGALTAEEAEALAGSYVFLRTVEHRLQTMHEIRTHLLPADPLGIRHLARRMGLGAGEEEAEVEFERLFARHTGAARRIRTRLFTNLFLEGSEEASRLTDHLLRPGGDAAPARDWIAARGFRDPDAVLAALDRLAGGPSPRARKFFASLCPRLLLRVADTPDPDRALINLERVVEALGAPATLFQLFSEYPDILAVFADVCGWSQHLSDLLVTNPAMIDAFADSLVVGERDGAQPFDDLPLAEIAEAPDPERLLFDLKDLATLRIGVRDIQRKANTENTARDLTLLAERVLRGALEVVRARLAAKYGAPAAGARGRFAILGLGKLGAGEMGYASDLDLLFVMDAAGRTEEGAECPEVLARGAQDLVRLLTSRGPRGRLYEVDTRVRPYGRSGPLVASLEGFARYYREQARVAERQMLTKARFVAGDADLGRDLGAAIEAVLYGEPPAPGVAAEVREMRRRLEESSRGRDVKRGFGGIVDIEFLVECLKLVHGHDHPGLRTPGTLTALAAARREGLLSAREHEGLLTSIQFLRTVESRMRIVYDMGRARIPEDREEQNRLARRLGYVDTEATEAGESLLVEYDYTTERTRELFEAVLGRQ